MKALLKFGFSILVILLLAGCSLSALPPNIPRTGGTPTGTVLTGTPSGTPPGSSTAAGAATLTPAANNLPTSTPAPQIITATPAATATVEAAAPTDTPAAGSAATPTTGAVSAPAGSGAPLATATAAPAISSIARPAQSQAIQFPPNTTSFVITTDLQQGGVKSYQLNASAGQRMFLTVDGNAVLQVYDPNANSLSGVLSAINPTQVSLSQTGTYTIVLQGAGPVVMSVYIPAAGSNQNIAVPLPAQFQRIQFQPGGTSASFTVNATPGTPLGYTLNVQAGQQMTVVTSGNATAALLAPDRATLIPSALMPTHQWLFNLAQSGNYNLVLLGAGPVTVTVSIPPTGNGTGNTAPTPIPMPGSSTRVSFGVGNASATLNASLAAGTPQAYVLSVQQGQTLYVSTTGSVDVTIYGPSKNVLVNGHASFPNRWSVTASQTGDYTFVISGSGPSTLVFYVPPQ